MKNLITIAIVLISLSLNAQTVPQDGRKTIKVDQKFDNEYTLEVFKSFGPAPYKYHMKKLPKKLAKYGFTNVEITAFGSVQPVANKVQDISVALAYAQVGANINTTLSQVNKTIDKSEFQVNFTSDQGTFKVRLSVFVGVKYVIAQN